MLFKTKMQQQELAQMRQRDANLTALAAIGPRKKRKVDSPGPGSGPEVPLGCRDRGWRASGVSLPLTLQGVGLSHHLHVVSPPSEYVLHLMLYIKSTYLWMSLEPSLCRRRFDLCSLYSEV